jgi:integrase/recombinase XerD
MMSRDLSARPHEILKLKIKDVVFKSQNGHNYAQVTVNGKTGNRNIPLFNSLPYVKDYLSSEHPFPANLNSPLICGQGKSIGRPISEKGLFKIYRAYKQELFPKLLNSPVVIPEDKPKIAELLKKLWNPYVVGRHTSLTAKAKILKEPILKMHAGWKPKSQMHLKYEHWLMVVRYGLKIIRMERVPHFTFVYQLSKVVNTNNNKNKKKRNNNI